MPHRPEREAGIALPLVLAVLVCLLAVAIPFSLSMRHSQTATSFRQNRLDARAEALALQKLVQTRLGEGAPVDGHDESPYFDSLDEVQFDEHEAARAYGFGELGPRGRLWSVDVEDLSGRIDLNTAPLPILARALGLSGRLVRGLGPEDEDIRLDDAHLFPESEGFVWIDGEVTYYKRRQGNTLMDIVRPAIVPGLWEPEDLDPDPRDFPARTEVIDFRAYLLRTEQFRKDPEFETRFQSLDEARSIARHGVGALPAEVVERLHQHFTVHAPMALRERWVHTQRLLMPIVRGETRTLNVPSGQYFGKGTVVRVTTAGGGREHGIVTGVRRQGRMYQIDLDQALTVESDIYRAFVDAQVTPAVNINTCSLRMLQLLLSGLKFVGPDRQMIDEGQAEVLARKILQARPLRGPRDLDALLEQMVIDTELSQELASVLYTNAHHSGEVGLEGSLPFAYSAEGTYGIQTAVSLNYALSGKEKSRSFMHEIVTAAPAGINSRLFVSQRDFEDGWRLSRRAHGWTTLPENLQLFALSEAWNDPPGRVVGELQYDLDRFAYEGSYVETDSLTKGAPEIVGARLASGRMLGFVGGNVTDVTLHFDEGDLISADVDGWRLTQGPPGALPIDGQRASDRARVMGTSAAGNIDLVDDPTTFNRLKPFVISMWWNPGETLDRSVLFDLGTPGRLLEDRVLLDFDGAELRLGVYDGSDHSLILTQVPGDVLTQVTYNFEEDGLELLADTWYHVTAVVRGNQPSQIALLVDHRARGRKQFFSRLSSNLPLGQPTDPNVGSLNNRISVEDGSAFPAAGGVLRVGRELVEYTSIQGNSILLTSPGSGDPFGGRAARGTHRFSSPQRTHVEGTAVELYGYAALLASVGANLSAAGFTPGNAPMGTFYVAKVDPDEASDDLPTGAPGNDRCQSYGRGIDGVRAGSLALAPLDGQGQVPDDAYSRSGGFALLFSWDFANSAGWRTADGNTVNGNKTAAGEWLGGMEVIYYSGYRNETLEGIRRQSNVPATTSQHLSNTKFRDPHAFVMRPDPWLVGAAFGTTSGMDNDWPVMVVPISIFVPNADDFPVPLAQSGGSGTPTQVNAVPAAEMVQIGLDFDATEATEWVRYNNISPNAGCLIRDNPTAFARLLNYLGANWTQQRNYDQSPTIFSQLTQRPDQFDPEDLAEEINFEDPADNSNNRLAFRGVLGTRVGSHSGNQPILPVLRFWRPGMDLHAPRPGRKDLITLVDGLGTRQEPHEINYGWADFGAEDWSGFSHVGLRLSIGAGLQGVAAYRDFNDQDALAVIANLLENSESRNYTRILKFPSGELPLVVPQGLFLGTDVDGTSTSSSAVIDEVRIVGASDPVADRPQGCLLLEFDLDENDTNRLQVHYDRIHFPHDTPGGAFIAALNLHAEFPEDGFVVQLGEELILCDEIASGDPIRMEIAVDGRGALGTEARFHHAGEPIYLLPHFVVSTLADGLSPNDSEVRLSDGIGFPNNGFVLIDQEVVGYTYLQAADSGSSLYSPTYRYRDAGASRSLPAFRGRFGTPVQNHEAGAVVFWLPHRYPDWYAPDADFPELGAMEVSVPARRGYFHSLLWQEEGRGDPRVRMHARARVLGKGTFAGDAADDPDLFSFDEPTDQGGAHRLGRQGDLLSIRFLVEYMPGAFDPLDFLSNSWKYAPLLSTVGVEFAADHVVEAHEEWR